MSGLLGGDRQDEAVWRDDRGGADADVPAGVALDAPVVVSQSRTRLPIAAHAGRMPLAQCGTAWPSPRSGWPRSQDGNGDRSRGVPRTTNGRGGWRRGEAMGGLPGRRRVVRRGCRRRRHPDGADDLPRVAGEPAARSGRLRPGRSGSMERAVPRLVEEAVAGPQLRRERGTSGGQQQCSDGEGDTSKVSRVVWRAPSAFRAGRVPRGAGRGRCVRRCKLGSPQLPASSRRLVLPQAGACRNHLGAARNPDAGAGTMLVGAGAGGALANGVPTPIETRFSVTGSALPPSRRAPRRDGAVERRAAAVERRSAAVERRAAAVERCSRRRRRTCRLRSLRTPAPTRRPGSWRSGLAASHGIAATLSRRRRRSVPREP